MPKNDLVDTVLLVVIIFTILILGVSVVSPVIQSTTADTESGERVKTAVEVNSPGEWVQINDYAGFNETVYSSRGYAVQLAGTPDSYIQTSENVDLANDETWTVSTWASVDANATNDTRTAVSVNGRATISYNGTRGEWVGWYYDEGARNSYMVNVSAPAPTGNLTNVMLVSNGTHLAIYRNNTVGEVEDTTTSQITAAPVGTSNWDGRIDELRTFDDALDQSTRQELVDAPIDAQPGTNRTARIMFDEPGQSTQLLLFAPGHVAQNNVTFSDGLDGEVLQEGQFAALGADYEWSNEGPQIKLLTNSEFADAPVVYVDYTQKRLSPLILVSDWKAALGLAALVPIILILGYIVVTLQNTRR